jgi:hypothetical protein
MKEFDFEKSSSAFASKIRLYVILGHALCLLPILFSDSFTKDAPQKLLVRTISLKESKAFEPVAIPEEAFAAQAPPPPPPAAVVAPQEEEAEEIAFEEEAPPPEVTVSEEEAPQEIIAQVEEEKVAPTSEPAPTHSVKPTTKKTPPPKPQPKPQPKPKPKIQPKKQKKPTPKTTPKTTPKPQVKPKTPPKEKPKPQPAKKTPAKDAPKSQKKAVDSAENSKKLAQEAALRQEQKREQEREQALFSDALSSLERSESIQAKKNSSSNVVASSKAPTKIAALASEGMVSIQATDGANYSSRERSYYDELVARLKLALKLPEYGEVKVKLTLTRQGQVAKVVVTAAKSQKNKTYIEKMLAKTSFPRFGDNFGSDKEHTFQLNLSNELSY